MTLARSVAEEVSATLPPSDLPACGPPDVFAGKMIGSIHKQPPGEKELATLKGAIARLGEAALHGTPVQRAVAAQAIILIGRPAIALEPVLTVESSAQLSAWHAAALSTLTCENWADGGIATTVPAAMQPPKAEEPSCDATTAGWLFDRAVDRSRDWPKHFFADAWDDATEGCDEISKDIAGVLTPMRVKNLLTLLNEGSVPRSLRISLLEDIETLGVAARPVAKGILPLMHSDDDEIHGESEMVVAAAAIPESVEAFRHLVLVDHTISWLWRDYVPALKPYAHELVPILAQALRAPNFDTRQAAARALGLLNTDEAIDPLRGAISSDDWPTTFAAIQSLAPFARRYPAARKALERVAGTYWSRSIRKIARQLLAGRPLEGNGCGGPAGWGGNPGHNSKPGMQRVCISGGGAPIGHGLKACRDGKFHSGRYRTDAGKVVSVNWLGPQDAGFPGRDMHKVVSWCGKGATSSYVDVKGGWLAGCNGFESSGALLFLPKQSSAEPIVIDNILAPTLIFKAEGKIFVAGTSPFEFNHAGGLYEVRRSTGGQWALKSVAALPSTPYSYAVVGKRIAFSDPYSAVLLDDKGSMTALHCAD